LLAVIGVMPAQSVWMLFARARAAKALALRLVPIRSIVCVFRTMMASVQLGRFGAVMRGMGAMA